MKIVYKVPVSGDRIIKKGETASVDDDVALRLISAGIAEATTKKAQEEALKKIEEAKKAALQKERDLEALLQREELEKERKTLLNRVYEINEILGTDMTVLWIKLDEEKIKDIEESSQKEEE